MKKKKAKSKTAAKKTEKEEHAGDGDEGIESSSSAERYLGAGGSRG
jgi:hypothetical protein